ncbi:SNF2 family N-terminal domain-containing protein [Xylariales sp. PMI_506]|nr:SNF2 family N-terminal domain-containing protein [Xylariales sp. PMI_506]
MMENGQSKREPLARLAQRSNALLQPLSSKVKGESPGKEPHLRALPGASPVLVEREPSASVAPHVSHPTLHQQARQQLGGSFQHQIPGSQSEDLGVLLQSRDTVQQRYNSELGTSQSWSQQPQLVPARQLTTCPQQPSLAATRQHGPCIRCARQSIAVICGACRKACYCGRECQINDWARHQVFCSAGLEDTGAGFSPASSASPYNTGLQRGNQAIAQIILSDHDISDDDRDIEGEIGDGEENGDMTLQIIQNLLDLPPIIVPKEDRQKTPAALLCKLLPHQRIGLTWLMEQEESNRKGGILADTMGLGKTIQALALILARPSNDCAFKTTLIIAPLALLKQWEREIDTKVRSGHKLKTVIYHGTKKNAMTVARLLSYDVVLTTYGTLAAEYSPRRMQGSRKILLGTKFHRIILDEAHNIKNRRSKACRAACEVRATYRLCMTGTPLMNNIAEVYSLIHFLRIPPYDIWHNFYRDIDKRMRSKSEHEKGLAMTRVQATLRSILLQRTEKSEIDGRPIIQLPELVSKTAAAEFDYDQRDFYDSLEQKVQLKFNKYLNAGTVGKNYSYILVLILRLRQACCHPHLIKDHGIPEGVDISAEDMASLALKLSDDVCTRIKEQAQFQCPVCDEQTSNPVLIYPCGHHVCGECFTGMMHLGESDSDHNAGPSLVCPSTGCTQGVDPTRVICHSAFLEAYMTAFSEDEKNEETSEGDEALETDNIDENGDLEDFIVPDDHRSTDGDEDEEAMNTGKDQDPEPPLKKVTPPPEIKHDSGGSDSDDSLPPLSEVWRHASNIASNKATLSVHDRQWQGEQSGKERAKPKFSSVSVKREYDLDSPSRSQHCVMKRETSSHDYKRQRVSKMEFSALSNYSGDEDDRKRKLKWKGKQNSLAKNMGVKVEGKREGDIKAKTVKKKKKPLTLGELKKESTKNAACKERYLKRLRAEWETSAKIDKTMELLRAIQDQNPQEKTLIFSVFASFLDLLEIPIHDAGYSYRRYDGSMNHSERDAAVEDFMTKGDVKIMLISLKAGNAGLNLQKATQVIILDPFWNPSVEDQAVGRAHRLGQKHSVTVNRVLIQGTIEDRILELQEKKRTLVSEVLSTEAAHSLSRLSVEELAKLFGIRTPQRKRNPERSNETAE